MSTHGGGMRQRANGGGNAGASSRVVYASTEARDAVRGFFGRDLTTEEIASLAGALPGSYVQVRGAPDENVVLVAHGPGYNPKTGDESGASYKSQRIISLTGTGGLRIHNYNFFPTPSAQGQGYGVRSLAAQVRTAQALGVREVTANASRHDQADADGPRSDGYWKWPRLGFDTYLENYPRIQRALPAEYRDAVMLSDLLARPGGLAWWQEHGITVGVTFDVTPGSRSMATLNGYLRAHGQPTIE